MSSRSKTTRKAPKEVAPREEMTAPNLAAHVTRRRQPRSSCPGLDALRDVPPCSLTTMRSW